MSKNKQAEETKEIPTPTEAPTSYLDAGPAVESVTLLKEFSEKDGASRYHADQAAIHLGALLVKTKLIAGPSSSEQAPTFGLFIVHA